MIGVKFGGCVYGPGVFMSESEAFEIKQELLARGTKTALQLAREIGMPSKMVHSGEGTDSPNADPGFGG